MGTKLGQTVFFNDLTPARLLATSNVAGTYYNGVSDNGIGATLTIAASSLTIDSVLVQVGDRVLLQGQTSSFQNGVYLVQSIDAVVVLIRAFDQQSFSQFKAGQFIFIGAGTANAGKSLCVVEPLPQHIGVDAIHYTLSTANSSGVVLPTIAGRLAVFLDTAGTIGDGNTQATNAGNISAGLDGTAGALISYPPTTLNGQLIVAASNASVNFTTTITNDVMSQSTVYIIPNPSDANGNFLVAPTTDPFVNGHFPIAFGTNGTMVDSGAKIIAGTTPAWGGGGTTNNFSIAGMTPAHVGACVVRSATNNAAVILATPGTNILTVDFSVDPGASTTLTYIYTSAALA